MLAKNPAGWAETLPVLVENTPVVIAVNGQEADGRDLSWLWDVPFEQLRGRHVVAAGERSADLAVRLRYADVSYQWERDPVRAIDLLAPGSVELVANYTAFRELVSRFDRDR
jgi:UDP-N-acetylmuramyl tripeptide synthase